MKSLAVIGYITEDAIIDPFTIKSINTPVPIAGGVYIVKNIENAIEEWNNRANNSICGCIMYVGNTLNYAHYIAYEKTGTLDARNEPIFNFYNDSIETTDSNGKVTYVTQATARDFMNQSLQEIYHVAVN